jgi:hypothetical protein
MRLVSTLSTHLYAPLLRSIPLSSKLPHPGALNIHSGTDTGATSATPPPPSPPPLPPLSPRCPRSSTPWCW